MKYLSVIVGFIFVFAVAAFSVVNTQTVTVVLPFTSFNLEMPMYLVIMSVAVISFLLGVLFMSFHSLMVALKKRKKQKEALKQAEEKENK